MKREDVKIGSTYYYNNRPVTIISEEGDTGFYRVLIKFNVDTEITGSDFCFACMAPSSDYKGGHTCGNADEVIEVVLDDIEDREIITISCKSFRKEPIEMVEYKKIKKEIASLKDETKKIREENHSLFQQKVQYKIALEEIKQRYKLKDEKFESLFKELDRKHQQQLKELSNIYEKEILKVEVKIGESGKRISSDRMLELLKSEILLNALEAGGVDNWEWYGESIGDLDIEKEALEEFLSL